MPARATRALLLLVVSPLFLSIDHAHAQTTLPPLVVDAPSPIVRRKPVVRPTPARPRIARPRTVAPEPRPAAPPPPPPVLGALPVITDQFATVTVIPNEELRRAPASTLGDLLFAKPGITGSSFAPGAASRPIIRGLDGNRVGIVENGTNAGGVSDLGEDHFVPISPIAANQVEVIRGPATLRYGSQSIGGVVSATNNRIPDRMPECRDRISGPCVNVETRGAITSADRGLEGGVLVDAAAGNVAIHADAFGRTASDYRVPSYPYLLDQTRPFSGRQPNSAARTDGGSLGASYIFASGFVGFAITQNNALYRIPGIDGADHGTRIDAGETKVTSKGEVRSQASGIEAVRFWLSATDYKHNELGLADPADPTSDGVRQTFTNKEQEGRIEVQLMPFDLRFAQLTTALGVQAAAQRLTAPGDTPGPFSGLWDPNENTRVAAYVFNELKFSETTKAQVAGRIEHVRLDGTTPQFPADFLPDGATLTASPRGREFTPKSISFGIIQTLPWDLVASVTAQHVERAPKPAELFSRGPHDATATFDIGNPNLGIETAQSIEVGLRRATGPLRFEATAYYTKFTGFIFRRLTGVMCDEEFATCGDPAAELKQAVYSQRNATFRGGEFSAQYDVAPVLRGLWGVETQFDAVRATFDDGTNVPRIPPMRLGGGVFYRDANWLARINLLHAFPQNDIGAFETPTGGYNLLKAEIGYTHRNANAAPGAPREYTVGLLGNNLLNANIRASTSYTKDEVLLPGASVKLFANVKF